MYDGYGTVDYGAIDTRSGPIVETQPEIQPETLKSVMRQIYKELNEMRGIADRILDEIIGPRPLKEESELNPAGAMDAAKILRAKAEQIRDTLLEIETQIGVGYD